MRSRHPPGWQHALAAAPRLQVRNHAGGMLAMPPDALEPTLASQGWKPHAVPVIAEVVRSAADRLDIRPGDLHELRRLAVLFWQDFPARQRADLDDWRASLALAIVRCDWRSG